MVAKRELAFIFGMSGVGLLVASWVVVGLGGKLAPVRAVPHLWTAVLLAALPASLILGVLAGWKGSKWWFLVSGLSLLSEAFCLLSVAV